MIYQIPYGKEGEFKEMEDPEIALVGGVASPDLDLDLSDNTARLSILFTGQNPFNPSDPKPGTICHKTPPLPFELNEEGLPELTEEQVETLLTDYLATLVKIV